LDAAGGVALTASADRTVRLWDVQRRQQLRGFPEADRPVAAVALSANGRLGIWETGGEPSTPAKPGTVGVWDLRSGRLLDAQERHGDRITAAALAADDAVAVTGSADGSLRLWRLPGA